MFAHSVGAESIALMLSDGFDHTYQILK
jgi:hypothetical protein